MGQVTMTENDVLIAATARNEQGRRSNVTRREKMALSLNQPFYFPPVPQVCAETVMKSCSNLREILKLTNLISIFE